MLAGNDHLSAPFTKQVDDPPTTAEVEVLVTVMPPDEVTIPFWRVKTPLTVAELQLTPAALLNVRLLAPVNPVPVTWADVPL